MAGSTVKDITARFRSDGADGVKADIVGIKESAKGIRTIEVEIDGNEDDWLATYAEVLAQKKELGDRLVIHVSGDLDESKFAEMDLVKKTLGKDVRFAVKVDTSEAMGKLAALKAVMSTNVLTAIPGIGGSSGGMSGMGEAGEGGEGGVGIMPFAIPAGIGAAGAVLPAAVAGGTGLAALVPVLAGAYLGYQKLDAAQQTAAQTSAAVTKEQDKLSTATSKTKAAIEQKLKYDEQQNAEAQKSVTALQAVGSGFMGIQAAVSKAKDVLINWAAPLAGPLLQDGIKAIGFLKPLLDDLTPAVKSVEPVIASLVNQLGKSISNGGIKEFLQWVGQNAGKSLEAFVGLAEAVGKLVASIIKMVGINTSLQFIKELTNIIAGLTPVISVVIAVLAKLITFIMGNRAAMIALGVVMVALGGPITAAIGLFIAVAAAASFIMQHWSGIAGFFEGVWNVSVAAFKAAYNWISKMLGDLVHDVAAMAAGFDGALHTAANAAASFNSTVVRYATNVINFFRKLPGEIVSALGGLAGSLTGIGARIVDGLISGIEGAAGRVLGTIRNLASQISNAFKSMMSIFSPSRVFADHGKNIVLGLVQGIEVNATMAQTATGKLVASVAHGASARGVVGAGAAGGNATINFNGVVTDPNATARQIQQMLLNLKRRNGSAALGLT